MAKPRMRPLAQSAAYDQTLVFFDGPQVILFRTDRGLPAIGLSVGEPGTDYYPLFVSEFLDSNWRRYIAEKVDLRYLFKEGSKKRYLANWASLENGRLALKRADVADDEALVPEPGFWARHQTTQIHPRHFESDTLASFAIDGSWDANDFSRFYGRAADLYAYLIVSAKDMAASLSATAMLSVQTAIRSQSFRGGGSYVGFYDKIFNNVDAFSPLRVSRIAYASPGHIDLRGSAEALADVARVVESFGTDTGEIADAYKFIDEVLRNQGLKREGPDAQFSNDTSRDVVREKAFLLNRGLGVEDPSQLFTLCDQNVLVFAKVSLSFYRRARDLYAFHAEGRVTPSDS